MEKFYHYFSFPLPNLTGKILFNASHEKERTMTEAVTPPAKKRRWRKPPTPMNNEKECNQTAINTTQFSDFLHPETLTDVDLICRLNEYHVPVNSNCSRDELVKLFSKHVMPKPQRKRKKRGQLEVNKYVI